MAKVAACPARDSTVANDSSRDNEYVLTGYRYVYSPPGSFLERLTTDLQTGILLVA
jgi:hypothetical protein